MSAYEAGRRAGRLDRRIGFKSDYAWWGVVLDPRGSYSREFSSGYRDGWQERDA